MALIVVVQTRNWTTYLPFGEQLFLPTVPHSHSENIYRILCTISLGFTWDAEAKYDEAFLYLCCLSFYFLFHSLITKVSPTTPL